MVIRTSTALAGYIPAFADPDQPFLWCYSSGPDALGQCETFTRGAFWSLACRAASVIRRHGLSKGDCFVHCFSANRCADLAFRLGATMVAAVPVTVNWQVDTPRNVAFKIRLTQSRLAITDGGTPRELLDALGDVHPQIAIFHADQLSEQPELPEDEFCCDADMNHEATRIIIFTSGTTGRPKGVRLGYRSYETNRKTFESFLRIGEQDLFATLVVNPLHHTNSTAITDWALRRPGTHLHLVQRYSTQYWSLLADIGTQGYDRIVAPLVSRHFDFLENLLNSGKLPVPLDALQHAMSRVDFLLGSAPVGPITIGRLQRHAGRVPLVRFGSTETCLQVTGTPIDLSADQRLEAFGKGWAHTWKGRGHSGYYIGRPHPPHTECRIVRSITPGEPDYLVDCPEGQPGYLITRGENLMLGYVNDIKATRQVMSDDGWYTGLGDICFWRTNNTDQQRDYYWMSRESALLIRGGANYSYDQIASELKVFVADTYSLGNDEFDVAVVGLRITSEHEDYCCVTVELSSPAALAKRTQIEGTFIASARKSVSKGARPDHLRFARIPRNFKGLILLPQLKNEFSSTIRHRQTT